jgi:hypothetical protein
MDAGGGGASRPQSSKVLDEIERIRLRRERRRDEQEAAREARRVEEAQLQLEAMAMAKALEHSSTRNMHRSRSQPRVCASPGGGGGGGGGGATLERRGSVGSLKSTSSHRQRSVEPAPRGSSQSVLDLEYRRMIKSFRDGVAPTSRPGSAMSSRGGSRLPSPSAAPPRLSVFVRKRPLNAEEHRMRLFDVVTVLDDGARVAVHEPKTKVDLTRVLETHTFAFDHVFDEEATNDEVYAVSQLAGCSWLSAARRCGGVAVARLSSPLRTVRVAVVSCVAAAGGEEQDQGASGRRNAHVLRVRPNGVRQDVHDGQHRVACSAGPVRDAGQGRVAEHKHGGDHRLLLRGLHGQGVYERL